jgi:hypothetical protein
LLATVRRSHRRHKGELAPACSAEGVIGFAGVDVSDGVVRWSLMLASQKRLAIGLTPLVRASRAESHGYLHSIALAGECPNQGCDGLFVMRL